MAIPAPIRPLGTLAVGSLGDWCDCQVVLMVVAERLLIYVPLDDSLRDTYVFAGMTIMTVFVALVAVLISDGCQYQLLM